MGSILVAGLEQVIVPAIAFTRTSSDPKFRSATNIPTHVLHFLFFFLIIFLSQAFNDVHMLMCSLGAKKEDATLNLMMSLRDYVR